MSDLNQRHGPRKSKPIRRSGEPVRGNEDEVYRLGVLTGKVRVYCDGRVLLVKAKKNQNAPLKDIEPRGLAKPLPTGYMTCKIWAGDGYVSCAAHRLVWRVFRGKIPAGKTVNHINFDKADNRIENLELCSMAENIQHAHDGGRCRKGTGHHSAKLTPAKVLACRSRVRAGESMASVAKSYGVHPRAVDRLIRGETWKHVPDEGEYTS